MKERIIKIGRLAAEIFFVIVGVAAAVFLLLWFCGLHPRIVLSGSMEPEIPVGSLCFVNVNYDFDEVKLGDVIAYRLSSGKEVTHRAVSVDEEGITAKGDQNELVDGTTITPSNYIGRTVYVIPGLGKVFLKLQTPVGIMATAGLFAILLCFSILQTKEEERREEERRRRRIRGRQLIPGHLNVSHAGKKVYTEDGTPLAQAR